MKRAIHVLYAICVMSVVLLFVYLCRDFRDDVFQPRGNKDYQYVTNYEKEDIKDEEAPIGVKSQYLIRQLEIPEGGNSLVFYTIHQNVRVYVGEELVYSLKPAENNPFGKTPGSTWNSVELYQSDMGKEIRIELIPVYESSRDIVPEFYFGSRISIWADVAGRSLFPLVLSILAIVCGVLFIIFSIVTRRNVEMNKSLMMMGMFSVNIGLWKLSDIDAMALFFRYSVALSYIPFLALMLVIIPFVLYMKSLFVKTSNIWYIPCLISAIVTLGSIGVQVAGIADLRETLWINHLVMGLLVIVALIMLFRELFLVGWNHRLKIMVLCMASCLVGMVADIVSYYLTNGASVMVMGMVGFLIYIIVLGVMSVKEARRLMSIGLKAKHYEEMAYHDQLTGLYNRAAYAEYIEKYDFKRKNSILVMCDLNDLKHCNDTWGHEKGDYYITNSAKLIYEVFGKIGRCYRVGGDEFCILLEGISLEKCHKLVEKLKIRTSVWNQESDEEFNIQIACGYAQYEKEFDYDLGDTLRRADRMMYHEKFKMKQN